MKVFNFTYHDQALIMTSWMLYCQQPYRNQSIISMWLCHIQYFVCLEAKVMTIPKHDKDTKFPQNLRPISLLFWRVRTHTEEKGLLNAIQFRFRDHHSTTLQCITLMNHITLNCNYDMSMAAVFLGIEKAFQTIWHLGLLYKSSELPPYCMVGHIWHTPHFNLYPIYVMTLLNVMPYFIHYGEHDLPSVVKMKLLWFLCLLCKLCFSCFVEVIHCTLIFF
jgi:hypothetical protein